MNKNNFYISEMEHFLAFLNRLPQSAITEIELGTKRIEINVVPATIVTDVHKKDEDIIVLNIVTQLNLIHSREEANSYFLSKGFKRSELEAICKQLDLPFTQKENMKILQEKIIEGTMGYKLKSQAIQK